MRLSKEDRKGIIILTIVGVLAIVFLAAPMLISHQKQDPETLCPLESKYRRTFFLVDTTDKLDARERRSLISELQNVKDDLQLNERLSIYLISDDIGGLSNAAFDKCSPRTGDDANPLFETERLIRQKYDREFGEKLDAIISALPETDDAAHSPIIESLADIAQEIRRSSMDWSDFRVIIFSDMMQHTPEWSHYKGAAYLYFDKFKSSKAGQAMMMDFEGAEVQVFYLLRSRTPSPELHRDFWTALLTTSNARWTWIPIT